MRFPSLDSANPNYPETWQTTFSVSLSGFPPPNPRRKGELVLATFILYHICSQLDKATVHKLGGILTQIQHDLL
jgi:hypothetical protein